MVNLPIPLQSKQTKNKKKRINIYQELLHHSFHKRQQAFNFVCLVFSLQLCSVKKTWHQMFTLYVYSGALHSVRWTYTHYTHYIVWECGVKTGNLVNNKVRARCVLVCVQSEIKCNVNSLKRKELKTEYGMLWCWERNGAKRFEKVTKTNKVRLPQTQQQQRRRRQKCIATLKFNKL